MAETKDHIVQGFRTIANKKNPDKISVIEICKAAHVSRETFYYHFNDKYDLFKYLYKQNLTERIQRHSGEKTWQDFIEKVIYDDKENRVFFKKILGKSSIEYSEIMFEELYEFYYNELSEGIDGGKLSEQVEAEIYIYILKERLIISSITMTTIRMFLMKIFQT